MIFHIAELQFWGNKQGISLYYQSQSYICIDFISFARRGEYPCSSSISGWKHHQLCFLSLTCHI